MSTMIASRADRRLSSPDGSETLTFLETSVETGGARTYLEAEITPGTSTPMHRHTTYGEDFEVLEGTLTVEVDGTRHQVGPGERAIAPMGSAHRFANDTGSVVRFRCALEPASRGFEELQQIGAGLAADGRTRGDMPKDPRVLGIGLRLADTTFAGPMRALEPILGVLGALGRRQGLEEELRGRYVRW